MRLLYQTVKIFTTTVPLLRYPFGPFYYSAKWLRTLAKQFPSLLQNIAKAFLRRSYAGFVLSKSWRSGRSWPLIGDNLKQNDALSAYVQSANKRSELAPWIQQRPESPMASRESYRRRFRSMLCSCDVRVTVGDSGVCCCVHVTFCERNLTMTWIAYSQCALISYRRRFRSLSCSCNVKEYL